MITPYIIDAHAHLGRTKGFQPPLHSAEHMVRLLDLTSTQLMIFSSLALIGQQ